MAEFPVRIKSEPVDTYAAETCETTNVNAIENQEHEDIARDIIVDEEQLPAASGSISAIKDPPAHFRPIIVKEEFSDEEIDPSASVPGNEMPNASPPKSPKEPAITKQKNVAVISLGEIIPIIKPEPINDEDQNSNCSALSLMADDMDGMEELSSAAHNNSAGEKSNAANATTRISPPHTVAVPAVRIKTEPGTEAQQSSGGEVSPAAQPALPPSPAQPALPPPPAQPALPPPPAQPALPHSPAQPPPAQAQPPLSPSPNQNAPILNGHDDDTEVGEDELSDGYFDDLLDTFEDLPDIKMTAPDLEELDTTDNFFDDFENEFLETKYSHTLRETQALEEQEKLEAEKSSKKHKKKRKKKSKKRGHSSSEEGNEGIEYPSTSADAKRKRARSRSRSAEREHSWFLDGMTTPSRYGNLPKINHNAAAATTTKVPDSQNLSSNNDRRVFRPHSPNFEDGGEIMDYEHERSSSRSSSHRSARLPSPSLFRPPSPAPPPRPPSPESFKKRTRHPRISPPRSFESGDKLELLVRRRSERPKQSADDNTELELPVNPKILARSEFMGFKPIKLERPVTEEKPLLTIAEKRQLALENATKALEALKLQRSNTFTEFRYTPTMIKSTNIDLTEQYPSPMRQVQTIEYSFNSTSPNIDVTKFGLMKFSPRVTKLMKAFGIGADKIHAKLQALTLPAGLKITGPEEDDKSTKDADEASKGSFYLSTETQTDAVTVIGGGRKDAFFDIGVQVTPQMHPIGTQADLSNVGMVQIRSNRSNTDIPLYNLLENMTANQLLAINDFAELVHSSQPSDNPAELYSLRRTLMDIYMSAFSGGAAVTTAAQPMQTLSSHVQPHSAVAPMRTVPTHTTQPLSSHVQPRSAAAPMRTVPTNTTQLLTMQNRSLNQAANTGGTMYQQQLQQQHLQQQQQQLHQQQQQVHHQQQQLQQQMQHHRVSTQNKQIPTHPEPIPVISNTYAYQQPLPPLTSAKTSQVSRYDPRIPRSLQPPPYGTATPEMIAAQNQNESQPSAKYYGRGGKRR